MTLPTGYNWKPKKFYRICQRLKTSGLYYKHFTIVIYNCSDTGLHYNRVMVVIYTFCLGLYDHKVRLLIAAYLL
jgi:hypothetical protein